MKSALAFVALASVGGVSASAINLQVPISMAVANPCGTAEIVSLSGFIHLVGKVDSSASGTTAKIHVNLQDVGGQTASGHHYRAQLNGKADLEFAPAVLPASASGNVNVRLISQGPADNFRLKLNFDVSVDANGKVTVTNPTAFPEGNCNG